MGIDYHLSKEFFSGKLKVHKNNLRNNEIGANFESDRNIVLPETGSLVLVYIQVYMYIHVQMCAS